MKVFTFLLAVSLFVPCISKATGISKVLNQHEPSFARRVAVIHAKGVDLTDIFALYEVAEFNEVYNHPLVFKNAVVQYLQQPVSFQDKLIAVCTMIKLPTSQYIGLLNAYYGLYCKRRIDEKLLNRCIFNDFDSRNRVFTEYKNPQLKQLFQKMINAKTLSRKFRNDLHEVLTGRPYREFKKWEEGQHH